MDIVNNNIKIIFRMVRGTSTTEICFTSILYNVSAGWVD